MVPPYGVLGHRIVLSLSKSSSRQQPTDPLGLEPVAIPAGTKHLRLNTPKIPSVGFYFFFSRRSSFRLTLVLFSPHLASPVVIKKERVRARFGSFRQRPIGLSVHSIELASRPALPARSPDLQGPPGLFSCSPTPTCAANLARLPLVHHRLASQAETTKRPARLVSASKAFLPGFFFPRAPRIATTTLFP